MGFSGVGVESKEHSELRVITTTVLVGMLSMKIDLNGVSKMGEGGLLHFLLGNVSDSGGPYLYVQRRLR